jgi:hypothetical protein
LRTGRECAGGRTFWTASYGAPSCRGAHCGDAKGRAMRVLLWIIGIIFLIGLAVVFGLFGLIF